ncbi:hypothetical protein [Pirellulimonas nuda]|uniref:hypothetical protein n=1 Tax=Pirellulimonas nuda TaxID=2528009 RepID=UPI0011A06528|nr:hypothetical protein [Pirellulimonas nuda]
MLDIIDRLEKYSEKGELVTIALETGEDEAVLIGTKEAYLNLALVLVKCVASVGGECIHEVGVGETRLRCSTSVASAFSQLGHVVPGSLCIAQSEIDSQLATRHFCET